MPLIPPGKSRSGQTALRTCLGPFVQSYNRLALTFPLGTSTLTRTPLLPPFSAIEGPYVSHHRDRSRSRAILILA